MPPIKQNRHARLEQNCWISCAASRRRLVPSTFTPARNDTLHLGQAGTMFPGGISREHPAELQHVKRCAARFFGRLRRELRQATHLEEAARFAPPGDDLLFANSIVFLS